MLFDKDTSLDLAFESRKVKIPSMMILFLQEILPTSHLRIRIFVEIFILKICFIAATIRRIK